MMEDYTGLVFYLCLPAFCLWVLALVILVVLWAKRGE
jgi:hypothetical protein